MFLIEESDQQRSLYFYQLRRRPNICITKSQNKHTHANIGLLTFHVPTREWGTLIIFVQVMIIGPVNFRAMHNNSESRFIAVSTVLLLPSEAVAARRGQGAYVPRRHQRGGTNNIIFNNF
jgi:hypothetical protein